MDILAELKPLSNSDPNADYQAGSCNIGPAEIGRRRAGHIGLLATVLLAALLWASGAASRLRLALALPASMMAMGYLQAYFRFCAGFGAAGVYNFGALGTRQTVTDREAQSRDRRKALFVGIASLTSGAGLAVVAAVRPFR
jgi:hypothetical protein